MDTWQLLKEILRGADFYWKKFIALALCLIVILVGVQIWKSQTKTSAEFAFSDLAQFSSFDLKEYNIDVSANGKVLVNALDQSRDLHIYPGYYDILIKLVDVPGSYIGKIRATINLPKDVSPNEVTQKMYAIHGVGSINYYMADNRTLVYEANEVSSEAYLSIEAQLPKSILRPPITKQIAFWIANIPADQYAIGAGVLPIITMIIMLFMIIKRRKDQIISYRAAPISSPPGPVPPAIAGVLIDGQVGAREIAATIIDLANRGYLYIVQRENYFTFGKRKSIDLDNLPELRNYERILLSKIFSQKDYKSTKDDVEMRVGHHIFSRKIAQVFLEIYNEATNLGYFIKNPASVHRRWRYSGIALFFLGMLGFIRDSIWAPDPKFTLIFWVGEIAAASVIVKFSGLMPSRSGQGSQVLGQWMAFRRFLKQSTPIKASSTSENLFNKYLPYAIVFGVEPEWAKRFFKATFVKPDWYESIDDVSSLEKFIGGLYPLISFVGELLAGAHDPTVE